ncbi:unannotated protein [freshwater metagenome]|uniref:Unannotated protein n=1 Tax=freshwater metagenome TaxID=449393 RepID=A0A6J7H4F3_9ZZZZ
MVFYVAPTPQPWGTYLEAAPVGESMFPDFGCEFLPGVASQLSDLLGGGAANSDLLLSECGVGAADAALVYENTYAGRTFDDWYLPNLSELKTLYTSNVRMRVTYTGFPYWSSSSPGFTGWVSLQKGSEPEANAERFVRHFVQPIRAFGPKGPGDTAASSTSAVVETQPATTAMVPVTTAKATTTTAAAAPTLAVSPSSHDFGTPDPSVPSDSAVFNITNTGSGSLSFSSLDYSGAHQYFFAPAVDCQGKTLVSGQSCTVSLSVYTAGPVPTGVYTASYVIVSNGGTRTITVSFISA